jgi:hypothetical protein
LREANRVSVATERGVNKQDFVDAYESVKYDWDRKRYGPGSANREFDDVQGAIYKAISGWDAAKNLWEMKDAWRAGQAPATRNLSQAILELQVAIGSEEFNKLHRGTEADGGFLFAESNLGSLISLCFTAASAHLGDAERAMSKLRQ